MAFKWKMALVELIQLYRDIRFKGPLQIVSVGHFFFFLKNRYVTIAKGSKRHQLLTKLNFLALCKSKAFIDDKIKLSCLQARKKFG